MSEDSSVPEEWCKKGDADLQTADLILEHGGDLEIAASHIQQGMEKYLKGFLISKGWGLEKTHDLPKLLDEAVKHKAGLEKFRELCGEYTALYFQSRYPLAGKPPAKEEVESALKKARELIDALTEEPAGMLREKRAAYGPVKKAKKR